MWGNGNEIPNFNFSIFVCKYTILMFCRAVHIVTVKKLVKVCNVKIGQVIAGVNLEWLERCVIDALLDIGNILLMAVLVSYIYKNYDKLVVY